MTTQNIALFKALGAKMAYLDQRQKILAQNVANADTPSFRPRDLSPLQFDRTQPTASGQISLARTENVHIASADGGSNRFQAARYGGYEARPSGNAVNLEDEMIKVAANQMDFQAATTLYTRSLGLIKTAIGKK